MKPLSCDVSGAQNFELAHRFMEKVCIPDITKIMIITGV
jgi:hypothetical protein